MEILAPLGLLALLGIVALIIIYIIKPRYQKKKISSTFVWKLSLKYRKRKIPLQWLQKSLLLFIQICVLGLMTVVLMEPATKVMGKDAEKAIILDTSYSMQASNGGESRFNRALKQLEKDLDNVSEENKLTIILGGNEPSYLVRRESSISSIKYALSNLECTYEECNFEGSLELANTVIDENPSTMVYFYTDCQYSNAGYVNVIDFSKNEWNVALTKVNKTFENGEYIFETAVTSYNKDASLNIALYIDGQFKTAQNVNLLSNNEQTVTFANQNIINYTDFKLEILTDSNQKLEDSLLDDNTYYEQNHDNIVHSVELVGKSNTFMSSSLKSCGNVDIFLPKEEKEIVYKDKELYVFDSYVPKKLPEDGIIWFINPTSAIPNINLTIGNTISGDFTFSGNNNLSDDGKEIMKFISPSSITATQYTQITNYQDFEVLMECNNSPVLLLGKYLNARIVILATDLHFTNLPITMNLVLLINNLFKNTIKDTIEKGVYNVGDVVTINAKVLTSELYFNNKIEMNEINYQNEINVTVDEPGIFEIKQVLNNGKVIIDKMFVKTPENESNFRYTVDQLAVEKYVNLELGIEGTPGANSFDYSSLVVYFAIALLVLVIIEWVVQYREQY